MLETYNLQRSIINTKIDNKPPALSDLKNKIPYLFNSDIFKNHFDHLVEKDSSTFPEIMQGEVAVLAKYFKTTTATIPVVVKLTEHFKEKVEFLIIVADVSC